MDFEIRDTPEVAAFRKEVREWLDANVSEDLLVHSPDPADYSDEQYRKRRELGRKLGAKGWLYPTYPKEYGGGGLPLDLAVVTAEEMEARFLESPPHYDHSNMPAASILIWGTEEQRRTLLPQLLRGEFVTWMLLTEPQGGTDLANVQTRAIRDGDDYIVNGTKTLVGSDRAPDLLWSIVLTDPGGPRHENVSWLLIPADLPGITIHPLPLLTNTSGVRIGSMPFKHKNSVYFDDVRVPAEWRIGEENKGWKVGGTTLELEHGGAGNIRHNRLLEWVFEYCGTTQLGGQPLIEDSDVRDVLADLYIDSELQRLFGLRSYWMAHAKQKQSYEGVLSSLHRRNASERLAFGLQKILGNAALVQDKELAPLSGYVNLVERAFFVSIHAGGSRNINKVNIARRLGIGRGYVEEAAPLPD